MKHRRRVFALPFVAIIGCGGGNKTPHNPPPPDKTEQVPETLAEPPEGTPTKGTGPAGQVMLTYPSGDIVYVGDDGTCHAQYKEHCGGGGTDDKPTVTHCNPPPPQQVRCPAEAK